MPTYCAVSRFLTGNGSPFLKTFYGICPIARLSRERIERAIDRRVPPPRRANGVDQVLELMGIGYG